MRDAILAAITLDIFNRNADKVVMGNIAQLVNCLHSLFLADGDKFIRTPTYHVFDMFTPHMNGRSVRTVFAAPAIGYERNGKPAKFFGLAGSASVAGKVLTLTVTNPHMTETVDGIISIRGAKAVSGTARILTTKDVHDHNTFEQPAAVEPRNAAVQIGSDGVSFSFAPASVTQFQVTLD